MVHCVPGPGIQDEKQVKNNLKKPTLKFKLILRGIKS